MLGNALIGLREGLEAGLVVSILVAFLVRTDRRSELPKVWLGVGIAVAVSVGVTLALALAQQQLTFEAPGGPLDLGGAARQARGRARHGPGCRGRDGHARRRP